MTYQPIIAGTGLTGFAFLKQTYDTQSKAFEAGPQISRDTAYFEEKIGEIDTAEDLVNDRRLLRVALGADGLQDDIDNRYFIRRILEDGTLNTDALANRLADDRYKDFSKAFGFGDFSTPRTKLSDFGTEVTARFRRQQFEVAVGQQDDSLRLALNAERALGELAESSGSENTKWFKIMGNPPLREVFETALGLPTSFGQLDIDRQLEVFKDRADSQLGSGDISDFTDPDHQKKLVERFLLKAQVADIQTASSGSIAVSLLQNAANFARSQSLI
jgi:hypothetical protein